MELRHIPIAELHLSAVNMRHGKRPPDVSDILPSIRARGILQPLLVRPNADGYEIVAGRRRYFSAKALAEEQGEVAPLPCAIMEQGDDAAALEASLIENVARLDPDEMSQYETFTRLIKEGRSVESIAATFGLTEIMVKQRLALGNLLPKIRDAYRAEEIDSETIRHLTLATKAQQKEWLKLFEDEDANVPFGYQLKQWLFGGQSITTKAALFPLEDYAGQIVTDLFGEESYFADADLFWELQRKAVEAKREALLNAKWSEVVVLDVGERFDQWSHEKTPKKKGGKVFVTLSHRGEVELHEGWLTRKEARKAERKGNGSEAVKSSPVARPAMTQAMENYLELHRHNIVRLALIAAPATAWRLAVAHAVAASGNWRVESDPQRTRNNDIRTSIENSPAQTAFGVERDAVAALIDTGDVEDETVSRDGFAHTARVFARLLTLSDAEVLRIAAFAMAETLAVGSAAVEAAGAVLKADPRGMWQPDEAFFDLLRDRATVNAMLAEVAGEAVAKGNATEKLKTQKQIIRDYLAGRNDRPKVENWVPGWMEFPFRGYGGGTCRIATHSEEIAA
jgi:ParB family chromosome partitioning protein